MATRFSSLNYKGNCIAALLLISFMWTNDGFSQSYSYRHYSQEDGLSSSTVYCAMQDSKGFMWFGTEAGVSRFDGKTFTRFTMDDGLTDNEVFQVREDSKGRIWFLTFNGRQCFYENEVIHNSENDSVLKKIVAPSNITQSFYEDSHGALWIALFHNGLVRVNGTDISYHDWGRNETALYVQEDSINDLWGIRVREMVKLTGNNVGAVKRIPYKVDNINCVYTKNNNLLFLNPLDSSIYLSEKLKFSKVISKEEIPRGELFHNLYMDPSQNIWLCMSGFGSYKYTLTDSGYKRTERFLPGKTVYSVFTDDENNTWFTTAGEGVYMLPAGYKNSYSYTITDGLSEMPVNSIARDEDGNIWMGMNNSAVNVIIKSGVKIINDLYSDSRFNRVLSMNCASDNFIWCGTDDRIWAFKDGLNSRAEIIDMCCEISYDGKVSVKSIAFDKKKRDVYLAVSNAVIRVAWDKSQGKYKPVVDKVLHLFREKRTFSVLYDHAGNLWVGNIEGLNCYDGEKNINYTESNPVLKTRITDIQEFKDSILVIGTYGQGILFFSNGKVRQQISTGNNLPGSICRKIFISDSEIWAATDRGLSKIVYEADSFFVALTLTTANGLISDNVMSVIDDGEKIYAATDKGLSVLQKDVHVERTHPPKVYVNKITTDDNSFSAKKIPVISYNNQRLIVDFIGVTFKTPHEIKYQYRLHGSTDKWTETINNSVEFSSLGPGNYIFELKAKKADSEWSEPVLTSFIISTPFWKTGWFMILLAGIAVLIVYLVIRFITTRKLRAQLALAREKQAVEAERNRIASDMHDDLGADLTSISIWSSIAEANSKDEQKVTKHIEHISTTSKSVLKKMDEIIWTLNPSNDTAGNLISYIHEFTLGFFETSSVSCRVTISPDIPLLNIPAAWRRNIFLAVKESVNNIVKHSGAQSASVDITTSGNTLTITITDDGKGFDVIQVKAISRRHGLGNLKKRLSDIGGNFEISSSPGKGTQTIITVPLNAISKVMSH
jgi:signal transduction histidine kinase/ligand-binding sensor domain-containing protein